MTSIYDPDISLIDRHFPDVYYRQILVGSTKKPFNESRFKEIEGFCNEYSIDRDLAPDLYKILERILPVNTLLGYEKIRALNAKPEKSKHKYAHCAPNCDDETEEDIGAQSRRNFIQSAYLGTARSFESYFKERGIAQGERAASRRYELIGRLMAMAGLYPRVNGQPLPDGKYTRRKRAFASDLADQTRKMIAERVRNWIQTPLSN
ncbi:MAG: hypothetical protein JST14_02490 [Bacteroidetes bacterium]|nr:hypothetical protein [Bacteroidota bacterium]